MIHIYDEVMLNRHPNPKREFIMTREKALYKSYLIRICNNESSQIHRVVLTHINEEGEQEHFISIDELMIFLLHEMDESKEEND